MLTVTGRLGVLQALAQQTMLSKAMAAPPKRLTAPAQKSTSVQSANGSLQLCSPLVVTVVVESAS